MRSIREICRKDYTDAQIKAWGGRKFDETERLRIIEHEYVWVVEDGGKICGYGHFFAADRSGDRFAWVTALYLTPEVVGKGLGSRILGEIESEVRKLGLKRVELESTLTALGFYRALGFTESGPRREVVINGEPIPCVPMVKTLTQ